MYILKIKQFLLLSVLILFSVQIEAKDNFFNWSNLSQEQYISKLVDCEYKLQEHKWSKNIWPEQNKNPKPTFSESVEIEKIRQQVLETLIMQSILADRFNIIITNKIWCTTLSVGGLFNTIK